MNLRHRPNSQAWSLFGLKIHVGREGPRKEGLNSKKVKARRLSEGPPAEDGVSGEGTSRIRVSRDSPAVVAPGEGPPGSLGKLPRADPPPDVPESEWNTHSTQVTSYKNSPRT